MERRVLVRMGGWFGGLVVVRRRRRSEGGLVWEGGAGEVVWGG